MIGMKKYCLVYCTVTLFFSVNAAAQRLPKGIFLSDSVMIGQPVSFAFSYRHPPTDNVFFPDSAYNFSPFQLIRQEVFPTSTDGRGSVDSVIYVLKSFVVRPELTLSLPVYLATETDSSVVTSLPDTLRLTQLVSKDALQAEEFKKDFTTVASEKPFDFWKYFNYALVLILVVGSIYFLFGNYLYRQFRLLLYKNRHRTFVSQFRRLAKESQNSQKVNEALILWKTHLQDIERMPFTTLTTKEIIENIPDERLGEALRTMDMNIYGDVQSPQMIFALNKLLDIANERYLENRRLYEAALKEKSKRKYV